ncbi:Fe-S cluster biogenesis protein NfuA, 4Fe-4S-binding domain [Reichenbachiella agariperforans]|uniref:Fe-S cluster biogenesis protein NfuA, 4Fe-4S-binding domain n=1 Tax=Reichenbachiella agariperforans TaxID=156994 RepID=A0A1M6NGF2_REIAG|nr:NifU family protein [Reichenbachiella agariperforans]SHJ94673.1 Fe-S cluster biogenesis protein NfuA, 4Fe-4S-binding domain [Reichenbachiella agariperforans]
MEDGVKNAPATIYLESNPNPNTLKFVVNYFLIPEGMNFDYPTVESATNSTLAQELFTFPFVKGVFVMSNFVTVTKDAETDWAEVQNGIRDHIKSYLDSGQSAVDLSKAYEQAQTEEQAAAPVSALDENIKGILDEYIRPAVEQDGGAISFHSYQDGVVKVVLQGSCSGCPSSTLTLKAGIENLLKRMVPEVKEVEAING